MRVAKTIINWHTFESNNGTIFYTKVHKSPPIAYKDNHVYLILLITYMAIWIKTIKYNLNFSS